MMGDDKAVASRSASAALSFSGRESIVARTIVESTKWRVSGGSLFCTGARRRNSPLLRCSASGGDGGGGTDKVVEEHRKRRAELTARISSDEFTALVPFRWLAPVAARLVKLGPPGELAAGLLTKVAGGARRGPELPRAVGSLASIAGEAFFLPLYNLFLTYGGVFRLNFGPKSFLIVSDPDVANHILRDNSKAYSKGILAEILEFVMGTGLILADGEVWRVRQRAIVPALHQKHIHSHGVNVISLSVVSSGYAPAFYEDSIATGAFGAVKKGIVVMRNANAFDVSGPHRNAMRVGVYGRKERQEKGLRLTGTGDGLLHATLVSDHAMHN
ncbi:Cytochrome P450 97B2 [Hordeum vulgare]|nr:Cytochrome P450 97B2 [Hordeum vulgare]